MVTSLPRNILSTYVVRLATLAAGLLLFPALASGVGLTRYGLWLLISSSVSLFFTLDLGMGTSALRHIAQAHTRSDHDTLNLTISTSVAFFAGLGLLLCSIYLGAMVLLWPALHVPAGDASLAVSMLITAASTTFLVGLPLGVFNTALMGIQRADVANAIQLVQVVIRTATIVALLWLGFGILAVVIADALIGLAAGCGALLACRRLIPNLHVSPSLVQVSLFTSMAPYSLQVFAMGITGLVILQTDNIIIGAALPVAMVAVYAGAYRPYLVCRQLTYALINPLVPDAARATAMARSERLQDLLVRGTKYSNAITLLIAVPAAVFAEPVLNAWAGRDVAAEAIVAQVLLVSLLVNNNHLVAYALLTGMGRIGAYLRYHVIWAIANVVLSILLVPHIGLVGVALGTALPVLVLEPLYLKVAIAEVGVDARHFLVTAVVRPLVTATAAVIPLLLSVWLLPGVTLPGALAISMCYAVVFAIIMGNFNMDRVERTFVRQALRRPWRRHVGKHVQHPL
jgi:O-antigen/teichoic acid export membrane protein